jgi:predicted Rossmann fold nucleotide-binding protein DprA/Smf involved in DNA uptake
LSDRLQSKAPPQLWAIGAVEILEAHKVGLFCSVRCPGDVILGAYDSARKLRDEGVTVVSGFHSPVEKECLRILLRGKQPIIICLARAFGKIRLPSDWRRALESGRLLLLSTFERRPPRPDKNSTAYRNEIVAAVSDEILIIHATPGGEIERISQLIEDWRIPRLK